MALSTFVNFRADFPDGPVWMENGQDLLKGPGLKTATELIQKLRENGFKVSNPCERDYYGWEFSVEGGISFVIQHGGEKDEEGTESLLLLSHISFLRRLFVAKKSEAFQRKVLEEMNEFLQNDGRFRSIRWFTEQDYWNNASADAHAGQVAP